MKDVMAIRRPVGRSDLRVVGKCFVIISSGCPSGFDIIVQPFQFDIEKAAWMESRRLLQPTIS